MLKGWWRQIAAAISSGRLFIVASPNSIEEFSEVVARPRFARLVDQTDSEEIAGLLRRAELHRPTDFPQVCRDPSDDFLLALSAAASADVLVTRDEDLLALGSYGQTEIIHVAEFLSRLASDTPNFST
ncbi:MAG: putative toxin-antitoxin system toxin component, PIN family [Phycisphaerales bacterium]|nr:putative toxin-antitoxin system toxin component, PIN family [Phycisphaerales bacterium]